jgi:hypothetical protein
MAARCVGLDGLGTGIVGSNPAQGIDVCLRLSALCRSVSTLENEECLCA